MSASTSTSTTSDAPKCSVPVLAAESVLVASEAMPEGSEKVKGYDFNQGIDHHALLQSYKRSGFQATNFGLAVDQINAMVGRKCFTLASS